MILVLVLPLTREWIEIFGESLLISGEWVLPLTREWIEISVYNGAVLYDARSPSYEGVD